jgi:exosortase/archaeosortase family protein
VNGIVGFALVGTAFGALVSGGRLRKAVWLTLGLALVWVFNVVRIVVIFAAGRAWGQRVADDGLHPFLGLVVFGAAVLLMVAAMPLFRLRIGANATSTDVLPPLRSRLQARPRAAVGMRLAGVSLAIGAVALTAVDGGLSRFELTAGDFGAPKVVGFDTTQSTVAGYASAEIASYPWVKNFFGSAASWQRYEYSPTYGTYGASFGGYGSGSQVIVDVIDSKHIGPFNAYGIEACYAFHGYSVTGEHTVDLGGVQGHVLQYKDSGRSWNVVYWIWVVDDGHGQKRYERVVLLQSAGTADSLDSAAATPDQNPLKGVGYVAPGTVATPLTPGQTERALHEGEDQLVAFARETVAGAAPVTSTGT